MYDGMGICYPALVISYFPLPYQITFFQAIARLLGRKWPCLAQKKRFAHFILLTSAMVARSEEKCIGSHLFGSYNIQWQSTK
jgi:hypothetical protein